MKKNIFLFISFFCSIGIFGQQIQMLNLDKQEISFRGLAVLDEFIFWVSGSEGTVGFSVNAGKSI
ncbi:MAG: hypothetical protein PHC38_09210, partial [Weeksellaceae bacterium]|nr:hypothetical protein [Weeksellaceae bacterium]